MGAGEKGGRIDLAQSDDTLSLHFDVIPRNINPTLARWIKAICDIAERAETAASWKQIGPSTLSRQTAKRLQH